MGIGSFYFFIRGEIMMQTLKTEILVGSGITLTLKDVIEVSRNKAKVTLNHTSVDKINRSRNYVEKLLREKKTVYGLTTGFGKFSDTYISSEDTKELQANLIRSHACGIGLALPEEVVRAIMLLRIKSLSLGYSGIRLEVVQTMIDMLNKDVVPVVPEKGSLGASGDLAPLSHVALVIFGEGEAAYEGRRMDGGMAMKLAGIQPISLEAKEGLALINGTQVMTAVGAIACYDALNLANWADATGALVARPYWV